MAASGIAATLIIFVVMMICSSWAANVGMDLVKNDSNKLKIAAFNIQIFGKAKAQKDNVMTDIAKIVSEFDITLIQEIREVTDVAITTLMSKLSSMGGQWAYKMSPRLGRTSSKEQYAYVYKYKIIFELNETLDMKQFRTMYMDSYALRQKRKTSVQILKTYKYDDSQHNYFEREPYGVLVEFRGNRFGLMGIHVKPAEAELEISHLVTVYDVAKNDLNTEDMLIMGDFNAGCSYVADKDWPNIRLRTDSRFTWLISDDQDTTLARSNCPYDRIVMAGKRMKELVYGQGGVYRFDQALGLTQRKAEDVSDHYPVYIQLYDDVLGTSSGTGLVFNPIWLLLIGASIIQLVSRS